MNVCIQCDDDTILSSCRIQDLIVTRGRESDFARVNRIETVNAKERDSASWRSLI